MRTVLVLGERAVREAKRTPDALLPTLLIPIFFLIVNTGQAAKIFPTGSTPWLEGQSYAAFQLPATLLLGRVVRHGRALPGGGDRERLLRQAAGDADLARVAGAGAAVGRGAEVDADDHRDPR